MAEPAPLKVLCPETKDEKGGVVISDVQAASFSVAGLLSVSASRIAVTGRQMFVAYLASQAAIPESAKDKLSSANKRAFSIVGKFFEFAISLAIWFHCPGGVAVPGPAAQTLAILV